MPRKRGRRLLTAGMAGLTAITAALLTGCSRDPDASVRLDPKNPVTVEIWHYYNGPQKTAFDDLVSQFNEGPGREQGVVVEAFSQGNVNELIQKVIDAADQKVGAGEIPDIFAAYADTAYQLDQKGLVASLDQYLTQEEINAYVTGYITEGRLDEEENLKIFPIAKSTEVFMLNKTDWDKFAGETGASLEDLSTIEGVTATARRYYEWSDGHAFFGRDAVANYMIIGSRQLGKEIFSVSGGRVIIQDDKEIVRKLWDNLYVPHVQGWFAANGKFRSDDVKTGDIIALVGSTSGSAYFPNEVNVSDTESYPIESLVMAAPCFENGEKFAVQQGAGMVVTKSDEKTEYGAVTFLKWFTDAQRNLDFSISSGYLPVKKEANTQEILAQALEKESAVSYAEHLKKTLPVAMDMVREYTMYTNKAFAGGTDARKVLENSMMDKMKEDLAAVEKLVAGGMSRKEAAASFVTDENFETWYKAFDKALREAAK